MIRFRNLTKTYKTGRGIFDLSFEIADGETFGCLGPKGAGKTALFSQLMGFTAPTRGWCTVNGKNCHDHQDEIQRLAGYLPERPEFPGAMSGIQFVRFEAAVRGVRSVEKAIRTAETLELNLEEKIYLMTCSQKQRLGIVSALLHDPKVLLLDEPTADLEPMMRYRLVELIQKEKARHRTVIWASRAYEDMERCCDRIGMMKEGNLVRIEDASSIQKVKRKSYVITFETGQEAQRYAEAKNGEVHSVCGNQVTVVVTGDLAPVLGSLDTYKVVGFEGIAQPLEEIFPYFYGGGAYA